MLILALYKAAELDISGIISDLNQLDAKSKPPCNARSLVSVKYNGID